MASQAPTRRRGIVNALTHGFHACSQGDADEIWIEPGLRSESLPPRLLSRRVRGAQRCLAGADGQHHRPELDCQRRIPCVLSRLQAHDVGDGIG